MSGRPDSPSGGPELVAGLDRAAQTRRGILFAAFASAAAGAFAGVGLAAGAVDYFLTLPGWARAAALAGAAGLSFAAGRRRVRLLRAATSPEMAARLEVACPPLGDRLVTAAEIAAGTLAAPAPVRDLLVGEGVRLFGNLGKGWEILAPEASRREVLLRLAPFVFLCGALLASPEGTLRHAGRFLIPGARIAPMTSTKLAVSPGDMRIVRGEDLVIEAATTGEIPSGARVRIRWGGGGLLGHDRREEKTMTSEGTGVFRMTLARPEDDFQYRVEAGDAVSFEYAVRVVVAPEMIEPKVVVTPPAYTGLLPTEAAPGPVSAVAGSRVHLGAGTAPEAAAASILLRPRGVPPRGEIAAVRPVEASMQDGRLDGTFRLDPDLDGGDWSLRLVGAGGEADPHPARWPLAAIPDRRPSVRLKQPGQDARATPVAEVPVVARATDDFGVARLRLWVGVESGPERILAEFVPPQPGRETEAAFTIALEDLDLAPGAIVTYRVEALDANDVTGPGVATSAVRFIEIVPFDAFYVWGGEVEFVEGPGARAADNIRRLLELEKSLLRRTVGEVGAPPAPAAAYDRLRAAQKGVRDRTDTLLAEIEEILAEDGVGGGEEVQAALSEASRAMSATEESLGARGTPEALASEREAATALHRALQAVLFRVLRAKSPCYNPGSCNRGGAGSGGRRGGRGRAGPQLRPSYAPSASVDELTDPSVAEEAAERAGDRPGVFGAAQEARRLADDALSAAASLRNAAAAAGDRAGAGTQNDADRISDELDRLAERAEALAEDPASRAGEGSLRSAARLLRQARLQGSPAYAPSGPVADGVGEAARLLAEARDALLDAAAREEETGEGRRREEVPQEYRDLVRDYFRRLAE